MNRLIGWLVVPVAAAYLLSGCNKSENNPGSAPAGNGPNVLHLAFVTNNAASFWDKAHKGCEKAQQEVPNIDVQFKIPSDISPAGQKAIIDDLLAGGIDGIAISPIKPEVQTDLLNDAAGKALLVTQDSDAPDSNRAFYIGTDNKAAGTQAGELIKEVLPKGGAIMLFVGKTDAQNAMDRIEGIKETLKDSNITVVDTRTDGGQADKAKSNAQDALVAHPEVNCMVGLYSYDGPAILSAVSEANKLDTVKIVCFDDDEGTLQGIKSGGIYGTIVQQPFEFGRQAVTNMAKYLRGDKSFVPATKQIFIPTLAIKKDQIDQFIADSNKMLGQ
jgi:ribose transport system substrate-binding protein